MIDQTPPDIAAGSPDDEVPVVSAPLHGTPATPAGALSDALAAEEVQPDPESAHVVVLDEITLVTESDTDSVPTVRLQRGDPSEPAAGAAPPDESELPATLRLRPPSRDDASLPETLRLRPPASAAGGPPAVAPSSGSGAGAGAAASAAPAAGTAHDGATAPAARGGEQADYQVFTGDHLSSLAGSLAFRAYQNLDPVATEIPGEYEPSVDERTAELTRRLAIKADVERGILPFGDLEPQLTRAEIEWLLSTYESDGFRGPVDWNDPAQRKRTGIDLRGANLRDLDLSGLPLARVRFGPTGGEWLGATQPGRDWAAAQMEGANLRGAHLEGALMRGAHLQGAYLTNATMTEATLIRANLERAELGGAELSRADLSEAQLIGANLTSAELPGANLHGAHLEGAIVRDANLVGADLHSAHLERAELDGARLDRAKLNAARLDGASLTVASLRAATLHTAHLEWASLNAAHLEEALLNGAHFEHATLNSAYLQKADLQEAHLEGADLRGAHLQGADLRRAVLDDQTTLADAMLSDRESGPAALGDIRWSGVDLTVVDWDTVLRLGDERSIDKRAGIAAYRAVVRAYRQVALQLRGQGMHEEADRYTYRALVRRRGVLLRQGNVPAYLFATFLRYFTGFGYKPVRALAWYLAALLAFAVAYVQLGYVQAGQVLLVGGSLGQWWQALQLSFVTFHGGGFFQPMQNLATPLSLLTLIEAVIGLILEVCFVISLAQRHLGAK